MSSREAIEELAGAVRRGGLIAPRSSGLVLVSGGADSACVAAATVAVCGPEQIAALHVNYGLRADADAGERAARDLCARLRIDLHVERPSLETGNLQARAREVRYAAAERLRARLAADWIATGHTRSDVAETVLYRLAVSPGTRALLGLAPRSGRVVRPLHAVSRADTRRLAAAAGLPFADDSSNAGSRFARNRIRSEVLPVLAEIGPGVERNIAATHAELHEEAELLERLVAAELERIGAGDGATALGVEDLRAMSPGLRRLALRALAERVAAGPVALGRARASEIVRLAARPEGGDVELGGGLLASVEAGMVRFRLAADAVPDPVRMPVPGSARYGSWELRAELRSDPAEPLGPELAMLDAALLGGEVEIRAWRSGDRIRPLGLDGSKSLQDLFVDRGVPRSLRGRLPVVVADGKVAWVAGVAVSEEFRHRSRSRDTAVITARALE